MDIIPGILTDNPQELKDLIEQADGVVERVHVDIIDGVFADNKTIDPSVLNDIDYQILLDFHLMVNEPVNWVEKCARAGADRIIGQVEMMTSISKFIEEVAEAGLYPGLALDINTPVSVVEKRLLNDLSVVLVMSVPAGFGGQKFHNEALGKIEELNKIRESDKTPFRICDDGGITLEYIDDVRREGADEAVIGQRIFQGDLAKNIAAYQKSSLS
jgi:ribulose-phosphate 3-epimerase